MLSHLRGLTVELWVDCVSHSAEAGQRYFATVYGARRLDLITTDVITTDTFIWW